MCGIVGYVGHSEAAPILLDGLRRLEYRGYDSAGVAIVNGDHVETRKCAGRIAALTKLMTEKPPTGSYGVSHTRWATHGKVNDENAHPHFDASGKIALQHGLGNKDAAGNVNDKGVVKFRKVEIKAL